jgi:hypothetical protein
MATRRTFIQQSAFGAIAVGIPGQFSFLADDGKDFSFESSYLKMQLRRDRSEFSFFSTDSLGFKQFSVNPLFKNVENTEEQYESRVRSKSIAYFLKTKKEHVPVWECKMHDKSFIIQTRWKNGLKVSPFEIIFSQKINHCTVLGNLRSDKQIDFPCVLHLPGMGTFRIYCNDPGITLFYDAELTKKPYVKIGLAAADSNHQDITYRFESVTIFPDIDKVKNDNTFNGFKKNYINIFQLSPRFRTLANNSTSDACAFTLFMYAEMARETPPLAEGLSAMDLIRNTLDQYLNGMLGYGMVGYGKDGKISWQSAYNSSDSFPSLIMAACYYIIDTKDLEWANKNYQGIAAWATKMMATDTNNDGIIEYGYSGNSDSWIKDFKRPSNWWDTIGFGHDDAYSNALAYRACTLLSQVAAILNNPGDSHNYDAFAKKLKSNYFSRFFNPDTGVLGGWRSADGELHDYYFTFVNGVAISYGLIEEADAKSIMQRLLDKMKEVGFTNFKLGLPGNLIPIADKDYTDRNTRWGYQNFQVYENGGASGCYVYFTIQALYKLKMEKEANEIFLALMESYNEVGFDGYCSNNNMTKDWKNWKGECWGYEGFLVDNYLPMLSITDYLETL